MGLNKGFSFSPLLTLSKQSTQAVQVLKNNSSYGSFQIVDPGMGERPCEQLLPCTCNMGTDVSCIQDALIRT
jgi:hypothetical protein